MILWTIVQTNVNSSKSDVIWIISRYGRGGIRTLDLRCVRAMSKTRLDDSPDYTDSIIYFTFVL